MRKNESKKNTMTLFLSNCQHTPRYIDNIGNLYVISMSTIFDGHNQDYNKLSSL